MLKRYQSLVLLLAASIGLNGCTGLYVTYDSAPQAAQLVCGGQFKGYTPTTLRYNIDARNLNQGFVSTVLC